MSKKGLMSSIQHLFKVQPGQADEEGKNAAADDETPANRLTDSTKNAKSTTNSSLSSGNVGKKNSNSDPEHQQHKDPPEQKSPPSSLPLYDKFNTNLAGLLLAGKGASSSLSQSKFLSPEPTRNELDNSTHSYDNNHPYSGNDGGSQQWKGDFKDKKANSGKDNSSQHSKKKNQGNRWGNKRDEKMNRYGSAPNHGGGGMEIYGPGPFGRGRGGLGMNPGPRFGGGRGGPMNMNAHHNMNMYSGRGGRGPGGRGPGPRGPGVLGGPPDLGPGFGPPTRRPGSAGRSDGGPQGPGMSYNKANDRDGGPDHGYYGPQGSRSNDTMPTNDSSPQGPVVPYTNPNDRDGPPTRRPGSAGRSDGGPQGPGRHYNNANGRDEDADHGYYGRQGSRSNDPMLPYGKNDTNMPGSGVMPKNTSSNDAMPPHGYYGPNGGSRRGNIQGLSMTPPNSGKGSAGMGRPPGFGISYGANQQQHNQRQQQHHGSKGKFHTSKVSESSKEAGTSKSDRMPLSTTANTSSKSQYDKPSKTPILDQKATSRKDRSDSSKKSSKATVKSSNVQGRLEAEKTSASAISNNNTSRSHGKQSRASSDSSPSKSSVSVESGNKAETEIKSSNLNDDGIERKDKFVTGKEQDPLTSASKLSKDGVSSTGVAGISIPRAKPQDIHYNSTDQESINTHKATSVPVPKHMESSKGIHNSLSQALTINTDIDLQIPRKNSQGIQRGSKNEESASLSSETKIHSSDTSAKAPSQISERGDTRFAIPRKPIGETSADPSETTPNSASMSIAIPRKKIEISLKRNSATMKRDTSVDTSTGKNLNIAIPRKKKDLSPAASEGSKTISGANVPINGPRDQTKTVDNEGEAVAIPRKARVQSASPEGSFKTLQTSKTEEASNRIKDNSVPVDNQAMVDVNVSIPRKKKAAIVDQSSNLPDEDKRTEKPASSEGSKTVPVSIDSQAMVDVNVSIPRKKKAAIADQSSNLPDEDKRTEKPRSKKDEYDISRPIPRKKKAATIVTDVPNQDIVGRIPRKKKDTTKAANLMETLVDTPEKNTPQKGEKLFEDSPSTRTESIMQEASSEINRRSRRQSSKENISNKSENLDENLPSDEDSPERRARQKARVPHRISYKDNRKDDHDSIMSFGTQELSPMSKNSSPADSIRERRSKRSHDQKRKNTAESSTRERVDNDTDATTPAKGTNGSMKKPDSKHPLSDTSQDTFTFLQSSDEDEKSYSESGKVDEALMNTPRVKEPQRGAREEEDYGSSANKSTSTKTNILDMFSDTDDSNSDASSTNALDNLRDDTMEKSEDQIKRKRGRPKMNSLEKMARGRPRKKRRGQQLSGDDNSDDDGDSALVKSVEKPKRKRGRPRKKPLEQIDNSDRDDSHANKQQDEVSTRSKTKAKRSRRLQKNIDNSDEDDADDEREEASVKQTEKPKKRGRGRPRKYPIADRDEATLTPEVPKKRGRGRPQKSNEDNEVTRTSEVPKKRGRGRPRKHPIPDADQATLTPEVAKKRGRGRGSKLEENDRVEHGDSDADEEEQLTDVPKKRGRGRPRKYPIEDVDEPILTPEVPKKRGPGGPRIRNKKKSPVKRGGSDADEEVETIRIPKKRGRGRPKRYPAEDTDEVTVTRDVPKKRGRGRPRKVAVEDEAPMERGGSEVDEETERIETPKKRGRGRPRKIPEEDKERGGSDADEEVEIIQIPKKRGRGRPRKSDVDEATLTPDVPKKRGRSRSRKVEDEDEAPVEQGRSEVDEETERIETPKKRGRGRPRKVAIEEKSPVERGDSDVDEEVEMIDIPKKRGPGRPRKYPVEDTDEATLTPEVPKKRGRGKPRRVAVEEKVHVEDARPKRKRGRPPKSSVSPDERSKRRRRRGGVSYEEIDIEDDSSIEEKPVKRGRGRPPKNSPSIASLRKRGNSQDTADKSPASAISDRSSRWVRRSTRKQQDKTFSKVDEDHSEDSTSSDDEERRQEKNTSEAANILSLTQQISALEAQNKELRSQIKASHQSSSEAASSEDEQENETETKIAESHLDMNVVEKFKSLLQKAKDETIDKEETDEQTDVVQVDTSVVEKFKAQLQEAKNKAKAPESNDEGEEGREVDMDVVNEFRLQLQQAQERSKEVPNSKSEEDKRMNINFIDFLSTQLQLARDQVNDSYESAMKEKEKSDASLMQKFREHVEKAYLKYKNEDKTDDVDDEKDEDLDTGIVSDFQAYLQKAREEANSSHEVAMKEKELIDMNILDEFKRRLQLEDGSSAVESGTIQDLKAELQREKDRYAEADRLHKEQTLALSRRLDALQREDDVSVDDESVKESESEETFSKQGETDGTGAAAREKQMKEILSALRESLISQPLEVKDNNDNEKNSDAAAAQINQYPREVIEQLKNRAYAKINKLKSKLHHSEQDRVKLQTVLKQEQDSHTATYVSLVECREQNAELQQKEAFFDNAMVQLQAQNQKLRKEGRDMQVALHEKIEALSDREKRIRELNIELIENVVMYEDTLAAGDVNRYETPRHTKSNEVEEPSGNFKEAASPSYTGKKRRGRPPKPSKPQTTSTQPTVGKKKRGRPKGSKTNKKRS